MPNRITEPEYLKVKLLNGTILQVRALTTKERKDLMLKIEEWSQHLEKQSDVFDLETKILIYILERCNDNITKELVEEQIDGFTAKKINNFALEAVLPNK
ncbi:MAG: hypothetical protein ACTSYR_02170 [Candidatus Odinarchaeia archaeon]